MRKKLVSIFLGVTMAVFFVGCQSAKTAENKKDSGKVEVTVSIEPLREFTEIVGGDKVNVKTMVPNGTEPHDFEPKTQDLLELNKAKVFVYNGLGMEHWKEQVLNTIENKEVKVVEASKGAEVLKEGDKVDPHLWLSLDGAKIEAENIKDALVEVDSDNKSYYEENFKKFSEKLDSLANEYKEKFNGLANKDFVTGHAAFGYLCREFGLKQVSVENLFGEGEITPQKMQEIVEFCKKNDIKTIFMPELASEKISQTLANEVGGKIEKIYTLESNEDGISYIDAMKENLSKIYNALSSQK
ncbi:metal ABC transporter substrate-binding protein [Clostridium perfringens]|uniref:metal ABC transporter substrate-binding protein n=1 Tax=Clostridium perfringens TaxID=1502 RepID=UPI002974F1DF|nr:metal ABC transporter substrate-binding protein [Clostridium perfringens]MDM0477327.1 metal ABC transporter substrate-binding protein [Clostridium perfringens]MDM0478967.1 metal ABC transporter substrate-binding protein [Clostridium perfringens]MDM0486093.1 metal ABC transporter substrate-binding protein [Clostridium perfringens]